MVEDEHVVRLSDELRLATTVGALRLVAEGKRLTNIEFHAGTAIAAATPAIGHEQPSDRLGTGGTASAGHRGILREAAAQLEAYFAGDLRDFTLALEPRGTEFQSATWEALLDIPYGETISYAELAGRIGRPRAVRAVGAANGANPLPIVIPCHRVIGSDGRLVGYGGGLEIKRFLLALERGALF